MKHAIHFIFRIFPLVCLGLIISGLYSGTWWMGFGLVLLMTSLLAAVMSFHEPTPAGQLETAKSGITPSKAA